MSARLESRPAWQTDELLDEWVDAEGWDSPSDRRTATTSSTRSRQDTHTRLSIEVNDAPAGQEISNQVGTFVVREDLPAAVMPQTPGKGKKSGMKDIFSPLPLERMFEPPSPPEQTTTPLPPSFPPVSVQRHSNKPARPSKLSQVVAVSSLEETEDGKAVEDEIVETDMPNMGVFGKHKAGPNCHFTFAVPRQSPPFLTPNFQSGQAVGFSSPRPQAQSTPNPPFQLSEQAQSSPDPRLRLFQFQYDTYTRDHLSALVDSFGVNSPSNGSSEQSPLPTPGTMLLTDQGLVHGNDTQANVAEESFSRLRSSKRIKLTPPSEVDEGTRKFFDLRSDGSAAKRDYVGESKSLMQQIKRARDISMMSIASMNNAQEGFEESTQVGPGKNGASLARDRNVTDMYLHVPEYPYDRPLSSASTSMTSCANSNGKGSKYSSLAIRRQAEDLMAKIKTDMITSRRLFSEKTEKSFASQKDEDDVRSLAPSPETRAQSALPTPYSRAKVNKENEPEPPSYAATVASARPIISPKRNGKRLIDHDHVDIHVKNNSPIVMPLMMPQRHDALVNGYPTDRVRSPNPTFLAPPSPAINGARSLPPTSQSTNDDLNRFVSSSTTATNATTATSLTAASSGSFVKHAGPAHMVRIAPTDLPSIPDRVGRMVFDHSRGRWVKERELTTQTVPQDVPLGTGHSEGESEDPFRDFESLRDEDSNKHDLTRMESEAGQFTVDKVGNETEDMQLVDTDSDSDFDDVEEAHLSTFSFDNPAAGIVQVMTGEADGGGEDDISTDSDEDFMEPEDEADLSKRVANMSFHETPRRQLVASSSSPARLGALALGNTNTPGGLEKQVIQLPRSALKSTNVTPVNRNGHRRSVSFSDGRTDGKIADHLISHTGVVARPAFDRTTVFPTAPSVRSKRIADMLEDLEEPSIEDESPSKTSQHSERPNRSLQAITRPLATLKSGNDTQRSFTRSRTIRSTQAVSPRKFKDTTSARANATFLTECSFAVTHDRLVQVITDVEPFEPYWESLTIIDLSVRKLDSVARLKEFLPKLDSLLLNDNSLSWLSGIPGSVRMLSVSANALTSLTSYSHLQNLENLDISYNDIDALHQLGCLRHLRELRADGNRISTLEGLAHIDGLLKLSVQGNEIKEVDFTTYRWPRLEMLDLSCNKIESVLGMGSLPALISLNLDNNALMTLDSSEGLKMNKLRILRLSGNRLERLDVSRFPYLRTLYVDNNCLSENTHQEGRFARQRLLNLHHLGKLENFSARNQSGIGKRDAGLHLQGEDIRDIKRLYLSGNPSPIPLRQTSQACYNLVYLELAACRLSMLPSNLSALMPNLRVLNLNYNFFETDDIARSLSGLTRLRKLSVVGSRMTGTKALIQMLGGMGENIEMLDFRMNPCTLGWYLPLLVQDNETPDALLQPSEAVQEQQTRFSTVLPASSASAITGGVERMKRGASARGGNGSQDVRGISAAAPSPMIGAGLAGCGPSTAISAQASATYSQRGPSRPASSLHADRESEPVPRSIVVATNSRSSMGKRPDQGASHWEALDAQFRTGLPDVAYAGRLAYRGLIMRACPHLKILDGVRTSEKERKKAEALLKRVLRNADAVNASFSRVVEQS